MMLRVARPSRSLRAAARFIPCVAALLALAAPPATAETDSRSAPPLSLPVPGVVQGESLPLSGSAVVNFDELVRQEELAGRPNPAIRARLADGEEDIEGPGETTPTNAPGSMVTPPPYVPLAISPPPSSSFIGLDDIPMADSGYIVVPPDVHGAVGANKIMESFNNNYRIRSKSNGATLSTVGTPTFWKNALSDKSLLNQLTDPRTVYDPINNRWIVEMQTFNSSGHVLIGVSQTSDPSGSWFLYDFDTGNSVDFPNIGFNKNWIVVAINRYSGGMFNRGIALVANYAQARNGTLTSVTTFNQLANTHFCSAPCVTLSDTEDTLFVVTHLNSVGANYEVDVITGTPSSPVYTNGAALTRPGGGWQSPNGNFLPQSPPNSGVSACGATPCAIETQDGQIRSEPVYRVDNTTGRGYIYYTQTVGLPAGGFTHIGVQWTKITPSRTAELADGGRIEDPSATSTNGGKWYAYPHIAVNSVGDFIVGYTQLSSSQHPSAGYSVHYASEGLGTIRDVLVYHAGEDYYHKTFSSTLGRNRWGDFSKAQVDPSDDRSLWVLQEYAKARTGTDDGNAGSNSSRWSTWWANVAGPVPTVTLAAGPSQSEGNGGTSAFAFTVSLSTGYSLPVTVNYQTSNGTATTADNDYQAVTSSLVIAAGNTSGTITVLVNGDTKCEGNETFNLTLTSATNGALGVPVVATATIIDDETRTITATAGTGGTISPSGASSFVCGSDPTYTITPADKCHAILDVTVDGVSQGAIPSFTFSDVLANHTIEATFTPLGPFTLTSSAGAGGSISPNGAVSVACGGSQTYDVVAADGHKIVDVKLDGVSQGAVPSVTLSDVQADHTIVVLFTDSSAPLVHVDSPNGGEVLNVGEHTKLAWTASDAGSGVADVDLFVSRDNGTTEEQIAAGIANTGTYDWLVTGPATNTGATPEFTALLRILATDGAANTASDVSDAPFAIFSGVTAAPEAAIHEFAIVSVAPNPSRGRARVVYTLPAEASVRLSVLDVQGREVAVLASGPLPSGRYQAVWDGETVRGRAPTALYFLQLDAGGVRKVRRLVLTR